MRNMKEQSISSSFPSSSKLVKEKSKGLGTKTRNWIIYFAIIFAITIGLPKLMAFGLGTPYPMATITSGSMWPALNSGDLVFMRGVDKENFKKGQVVVFSSPNGPVIHRIEEVRSDTIITRGDANINADTPVNKNDVLGAAITIGKTPIKIPYVGKLVMAIRGK